MEKKLYRVKVVLFVMAESEADACAAATQAHFDIFECAARRAVTIAPDWQDAIPYNADDDRTCSEIMNNSQQAARPESRLLMSKRGYGSSILTINPSSPDNKPDLIDLQVPGSPPSGGGKHSPPVGCGRGVFVVL